MEVTSERIHKVSYEKLIRKGKLKDTLYGITRYENLVFYNTNLFFPIEV